MIRRWKTKNRIATGIVISVAAASSSGYCWPAPSPPPASWATPLVRLTSSGELAATMCQLRDMDWFAAEFGLRSAG